MVESPTPYANPGRIVYRDAGHLRRNLPQDVTMRLADQLGLGGLLPEPVASPIKLATQ